MHNYAEQAEANKKFKQMEIALICYPTRGYEGLSRDNLTKKYVQSIFGRKKNDKDIESYFIIAHETTKEKEKGGGGEGNKHNVKRLTTLNTHSPNVTTSKHAGEMTNNLVLHKQTCKSK